MEITGQAQHTKETNQEAFMKGGDSVSYTHL